MSFPVLASTLAATLCRASLPHLAQKSFAPPASPPYTAKHAPQRVTQDYDGDERRKEEVLATR